MKRVWFCSFSFVLLMLPVVPAIAQTDAPAVCLIGDHPGIPASNAQTAALLICDALRKQGISVTDPVYEAPASANVYRIVLGRLGEKVFVRLSQESPIGTVIAERQMTLANIEEMIPAAPRLVEALIHRKPIDATVDMETVVEQEARKLRKISGESLWHIGIFGISLPGTGISGKPMVGFGWSFERPSFAAVTDLRFGFEEEEDWFATDGDRFSYFSWSIGGNYFLNKKNISPYVGGGLAYVGAQYETTTEEPSVEGKDGLGAYAAIGIQALRLTQSRLKFELRVDRTLFELPPEDTFPITVGVSFSRNYVPGGSCLF